MYVLYILVYSRIGCAKNSSQSANIYCQNTIIIGLFCNMISNRDIVCMERKILFSFHFCGLTCVYPT